LGTIEDAFADLQAKLLQQQQETHQMRMQHDQETRQYKLELEQIQSSRSAAEGRVQLLMARESQLQEQLLLGDHQAADAVSRFQEQIRQAHSAQAAAEGEVQTLTLRIKQLELQLQRQAVASVESRAQVDSLEIRLTEMNRTHGEVQQQLMSASLELSAFRQKAAQLQAAAERTYVMWYSHALYHAHHTYDARM
jgi:chromosome segregation ATPase